MNNLDKRLIIIKCLKKWRQSYQLSHHLYKNVDELNKCINEITGIEKMTWFVPSIEGDRQIHSECKELNFDPFLELKLISELKNFKNIDEMNLFWDDIERKISTSLYQINLDKFNSVITITDISLRRVQLVEILLICNNIYYKTHESKKESYLSIAKECRKKDIIIDWWCEKWLLKDKERSVNYSLFPIEFNSLKKEFLFVSKIDIIEVNPFNLDLLLKNFHSKEYIQTVKYNKLSRLKFLSIAIISCILFAIIISYYYVEKNLNLDDISKSLILLPIINLVFVFWGTNLISSIKNEKHFYDNITKIEE